MKKGLHAAKYWSRLALSLFSVLAAMLWLADQLWPLPVPDDGLAHVILAEDGEPLYRFADGQGIWRYPATPDTVSPYYLDALLAYEDRWFYQHPGINPAALARAAWLNLSSGRVVSGGSTLSMQVARLLEPHSRTFAGKLRQLFRTAQLECHLSKQEILTLYLNRAPFGGTLEGVAAASWTYLGKSPVNLTRAEAALLAVLPQAPSRLRPDRFPERAQAARDKVLARLDSEGVWPAKAVKEAMEEPVWLAPRQSPDQAPLLARRLNTPGESPAIHTTIDIALQRRLESLLLDWRARLPERTSAAIIVVDTGSMAVKAYLGSVDITDDRRFGHVDMVSAIRSPGSTLKPFLYAQALDAGLIHSESLLQDVPRRFGDYRPGNFSSGFSGPVAASEALHRSLNLPAVQLLEAYGSKRFSGELRSAGVPLFYPRGAEPNLSLILGGVGARLEDLASGYSAFAREGKVARLRFRPEEPVMERRLMSPGAAWIVRRMLADRSDPLLDEAQLPPALAYKTGTSYGFRDAWSIGITPGYVIGVWIGRPDGTPVAGQFGLASAAPLLFQVNDILLNRDTQRGRLSPIQTRPASVGVESICWPGGQPLPADDENCRVRRWAFTLDKQTPPTMQAPDQPLGQGLDETYWVNEAGKQVAPSCSGARPVRFLAWPASLEPWLAARERRMSRLPSVDSNCAPTLGTAASPLQITGLRDGARLQAPAGQSEPVSITVTAQGGEGSRWWFVNGEPVAEQSEQLSYTFPRPGAYEISVLDDSGQTEQVNVTVVR
ncbi:MULTISPECIES: peptidoglycan glycosyltransferase PbpC [unclassified Pseudomonas]|uniref:peptidoglycan glycosyltransferase PbpC n=1 Tax=unclassified Pseudomonas TaxID=196821 RepID=UPI00257F0FB8|nr:MULTISPECIES: peptidoglycan glycosyltransferase PbpC [unclassified Pseudomonas]